MDKSSSIVRAGGGQRGTLIAPHGIEKLRPGLSFYRSQLPFYARIGVMSRAEPSGEPRFWSDT
jgi:hypothetical protein